MSDQTETPEAGAPDTTETAAPQIDTAPILEQFERLDSRFNAIEAALGNQGQTQPAQEDPYAGVNQYAEALGFNVPAEPEDDTAALHALAQLGDERAQRIVEQRVDPRIQAMEQRLAEFQARDDLRQLHTQYPKLATPEVETAVTEKLQDIRSELPPGTPVTKSMVALAYRAWEADQMATGEGSVSQNTNELEHPNGAGPEGSSELTWSQQIMRGAGAGDKGASFWGYNAL
jgi:hypothetical protein